MKPSPDSKRPVSEDELVAHLFGDADDPASVEDALSGSGELRRTYDELRRTLELVDGDPIPERSDDYGAEVWRRIESRLGEGRDESEPAPEPPAAIVSLSDHRTRRRLPSWIGLAAAAVLLLAAGFLLGRFGTPQPADSSKIAQITQIDPDDAGALTPRARQRLLNAALTEHFGRSERLLTELANASQRNLTGPEMESLWAAELLAANRLYRRAAEEAGQKRIAGVLAELEPVLLELAHVDPARSSEETADELDQLRERVDERGLLFKVRLTERRLDSI